VNLANSDLHPLRCHDLRAGHRCWWLQARQTTLGPVRSGDTLMNLTSNMTFDLSIWSWCPDFGPKGQILEQGFCKQQAALLLLFWRGKRRANLRITLLQTPICTVAIIFVRVCFRLHVTHGYYCVGDKRWYPELREFNRLISWVCGFQTVLKELDFMLCVKAFPQRERKVGCRLVCCVCVCVCFVWLYLRSSEQTQLRNNLSSSSFIPPHRQSEYRIGVPWIKTWLHWIFNPRHAFYMSSKRQEKFELAVDV
jgi:hypothetical protein